MSAGGIGQQIINGTYGLDNRPPTAYEELKAWCEKHLNECDWYTHACANHQTCLGIVDAHADFFFNEDGSLDWIDN